jgi:hypothetical protein
MSSSRWDSGAKIGIYRCKSCNALTMSLSSCWNCGAPKEKLKSLGRLR